MPLREWVRDDRFWRDIAAQAIAGLISGIVLAILATVWLALLGVIPVIGWKAVVIAVGLGLVALGGVLNSRPRTWTQRAGESEADLYRRVHRSNLPSFVMIVGGFAATIIATLLPGGVVH